MGRMLARIVGLAVVLAVVAPSVASAAPNGSVAGWRSPAAGTMDLFVQATPDPVTGAALRSARATLGGFEYPTESFADGTCSLTCPAIVVLAVDTTVETSEGARKVPDGERELVVTIEDVNGEEKVIRQTITVDNRPIVDNRSVTVRIGSGTVTAPSSPPGGGVGGEQGPSCRSPQLSMRLAQRPLRFRRGVPVLARGRAYRYAGRADLPHQRSPPPCAARHGGPGPQPPARRLDRRQAVDRGAQGRRDRHPARLPQLAHDHLPRPRRGRRGGPRAHSDPGRAPVRSLALAAGILLLAAAPAAAQTDVGGSVPSMLELRLDDPSGFDSFPAGPGEHELAIHARITSTGNRAFVRVADGDVASGNRLGRMASNASVLDEPLEARVGSDPFQPLNTEIDPILAEFGPVSSERVTIRLRQRIGAGERPRGTYTKTLLVTLSSNAP